MSTVTAPARMTAEEFAEWAQRPENADRWFELVRGEVIELPVPMKIHGRVCINIGYLLEAYVRQRGFGYVTGNDSGVILERDPDTVRGPDVALYEDARSFEELHPKYGEIPPRLAVEVMSPSDRIGRVMDKVSDYLRNGVALVWLVDPDMRNVTVCRPDRPPEVVKADQELLAEDVLPGFRCRVSEFFFVPGQPAAPPSGT
ncbi:MAG: Uma2 family endonuclease [Planctomycetes bacterium]|nr:Uma2 family endonuclease [Planctomycetota bacterium]